MSGDVDRDGVERTDPRRGGQNWCSIAQCGRAAIRLDPPQDDGGRIDVIAIGNLAVSGQYLAVVAGLDKPLMKAGINLCDQMMSVDGIKDNDEDDVDDTDK